MQNHVISFLNYSTNKNLTNTTSGLTQTRCHASMSDSRFLWRIVSLTALNTTLIFSVSTAVVKWWNNGFLGSLFTLVNIAKMNAWTSAKLRGSPENWGKYVRKSDSPEQTFCVSRSVLFRNKMIDTPRNTRLLTIVSNMLRDSSKRLVRL